MSAFDMYQNSGYINTRNRKKTLILDITDVGNSSLALSGNWNISLREPLIIDKHSEIYLDNFMTQNCNLNSTAASSHIAFALRINEFQIDNNVASTIDKSGSIISNSIIIPNENSSQENYFKAVVHKGKKFNYVCDINPTTIHSLSGSLTDLIGNPIFHGDLDTNRFTYALVGIKVWTNSSATSGREDRALHDLELINLITRTAADNTVTTIMDATGGDTAQILVNTVNSAATIYFTSSVDIDLTDVLGQTVQIQLPGLPPELAPKTIALNASENPTMMLIKAGTRAIAEFSIIAKGE